MVRLSPKASALEAYLCLMSFLCPTTWIRVPRPPGLAMPPRPRPDPCAGTSKRAASRQAWGAWIKSQ